MDKINLVVVVFLASFLGGLLGSQANSYLQNSSQPVQTAQPEAKQVKDRATAPVVEQLPEHQTRVKPEHQTRVNKVVLLVDNIKMLSFHNYKSRWLDIPHQLKSCHSDLTALKSRVSAHPELYPGENPNNYACVVVNSTS